MDISFIISRTTICWNLYMVSSSQNKKKTYQNTVSFISYIIKIKELQYRAMIISDIQQFIGDNNTVPFISCTSKDKVIM